MANLLFVYGTLKDPNSELMKGNKLVSDQAFVKGVNLYQIGAWFPGVTYSDDAEDTVYGSIFEVPGNFKILDEYEGFEVGNPAHSLFVRSRVYGYMNKEDRAGVPVWMYIYNGHPREKIEGGVWQPTNS